MAKIRLYTYATSPYGMKVACFLKYKQLEFTHVHVNPITNRQIAFTRQRQVPVLKIGDEWRRDSTPLGIWLDELYPERPMLGRNDTEREKVLQVDRWISDDLIPATFRLAVDWSDLREAAQRGWRLAEIVNDGTRLPYTVRLFWPAIIRYVPFIDRMVAPLEHEPIEAMTQRLCQEFLAHLGDGPYLAGMQQPSLADLSAFTTLFAARMMGVKAETSFHRDANVGAWGRRVYDHLPANPFLADDKFMTGSIPQAS